MTLIDKIIKILINFRYKREPFMAWSWGIDEIHEINILSAEYHNDHYRYGVREEYYKEEREKLIKDLQENQELLSMGHYDYNQKGGKEE